MDPGVPGTPTRTYADKTKISLVWIAPTSTGGSVISDYEVFMDDGNGGSFTSRGKTGNGSTLVWQATSLTTGLGYYFKVSY